MYGDDIANVNLEKLVKKYLSYKGKKVIITVYKKNSQYGHVQVNGSGKVIKFIEKPPHPLPINIGFYLLSRENMKKNFKKNLELENDFLPKISKKNILESFEIKDIFMYNDKKELLTARNKLKKL